VVAAVQVPVQQTLPVAQVVPSGIGGFEQTPMLQVPTS